MTYWLLVPLEGPVHLMPENLDRDTGDLLRSAGGRGPLSQIEMITDGTGAGTAFMLLDSDGTPNRRAREVMAALTMVHMVLVGPVVFTGLGERVARDLIAYLST